MECLHIGTPPSALGCWESKTIYVHDFLNLSDTKSDDNVVYSPEFKCFGHFWKLVVFPGGSEVASDGNVSLFIDNMSGETITTDCKISVLKKDGNTSQYSKLMKKITFAKNSVNYELKKGESYSYGSHSLIKREIIVGSPSDFLYHGSLRIKVQMRLSAGCYHNRIRRDFPEPDFVHIFGDDETTDIAFDLKGKIILAHKCIIKCKANDLYVMCEAYNKTTPMPIDDVDEVVFEIMLVSLYYGGDLFPEEWQNHSEAILNAAGKYGFDALRSEAEVWYSKSLKFTVDNVIGEFMKADGNNHALVKAAAKKFMMKHGEEIVASESFHLLYESKELVREVMAGMAASFQNSKKRKRDSNPG
eukprot:scaffold102385_cov55-Cyclotella_meneghiniana.AAC.4